MYKKILISFGMLIGFAFAVDDLYDYKRLKNMKPQERFALAEKAMIDQKHNEAFLVFTVMDTCDLPPYRQIAKMSLGHFAYNGWIEINGKPNYERAQSYYATLLGDQNLPDEFKELARSQLALIKKHLTPPAPRSYSLYVYAMTPLILLLLYFGFC